MQTSRLRRGLSPALTALLAAGLLLGSACQDRLTVANKGGDREAAARAEAMEARRQAIQAGQAKPQQAVGQLQDADLELVYKAILATYIEPVDYPTLIYAASAAVERAVDEAGYPPLTTAPLMTLSVPTGSPERDFFSFVRALDTVKQKSPAWVEGGRPDYVVVQAMLDSLKDRQAAFVTAEERKRRAETGPASIGVILVPGEPGQPIAIAEVLPNSPAALVGLRAGDRILRVNEEDVSTATPEKTASLLRGQQGTEVEIEVDRNGARSTVRAFRRQVEVAAAEYEPLGDGLGYLRVRNFDQQTVVERIGSLLTGARQGLMLTAARQGLRGLVLDLRRNSGGSVDVVRKAAGFFMPVRPVAISTDRSGQRTAVFSEQRPLQVSVPLVVLVDRQTAFGAEVLAAALREYQLATLVGTRTAGMVAMTAQQQLSDSSVFQITTGRLSTPSGAAIDQAGVQPDVEVPTSLEDLAAGRDPQRERAVQVLRDRLR